MTRKKKPDDSGVHLPPWIVEADYPAGDGPEWVSQALGVPGCFEGVTRYLSDDGDETALVLRFENGTEQVLRPARLVTTRRLTETLGALGFPIPYYQPPQLALLGQVIGRIADRGQTQHEESVAAEYASVVAGWAVDCLQSNVSFVLRGRAGRDVRAAIEHVRRGTVEGSSTVPLIVEPDRKLLLAWTVPARGVIRAKMGTASDGSIGLQLRRVGVARERLAARPIEPRRRTHELPVWALYNGWQGVEVDFSLCEGESGALSLPPLESVPDLLHARARRRTRT